MVVPASKPNRHKHAGARVQYRHGVQGRLVQDIGLRGYLDEEGGLSGVEHDAHVLQNAGEVRRPHAAVVDTARIAPLSRAKPIEAASKPK